MVKALALASVLLLAVLLGMWLMRGERPGLFRCEEPGQIHHGERIATPPGGTPMATLQVLAIGPDTPVHVGQATDIRFVLKNLGPKPAWVLRSLDGSEGGRYPRSILEIRNADGVPQSPTPPPGCGNHNPLQASDFIRLSAGETLNEPLASSIYWWKPAAPGMYTVTLTYDTSSPYLASYAGDACSLDGRTRELLSVIPKGTVVSNLVQITVVP